MWGVTTAGRQCCLAPGLPGNWNRAGERHCNRAGLDVRDVQSLIHGPGYPAVADYPRRGT